MGVRMARARLVLVEMAPYFMQVTGPETPLVSVVTPVHNGGRYLAECIESVLAQSYCLLEHVILDNASRDQTYAVARHYAARDPRIRLIGTDELLPVIPNWNRALGHVSPRARYVWVLPADDTMMPESLMRMVDVAVRNPSVGIVGALRLRGGRLQCGGLPTHRNVFPGREVGRMFLREQVFAIAPTGNLIRRDLIDDNMPFYPDRYLHADIAAFLNVLERVDFGFVHEVLMLSRVHGESVTATVANRKGSQYRDTLLMLQEYGPRYLDPEEMARLEARFLRRYYRFLVRNAVLLRESSFFSYHGEGLRAADRFPDVADLARAVLGEMGQAILRPGAFVSHVRARLRDC